MIYKLIEHGEVVQTGELIDNIFRGKNIKEAKRFFNVSDTFAFNHPQIEFISDDGRVIVKNEMKRTDKGFASAVYEYGMLYGCNLNRIKNRAGRWGLTVWEEPTAEQAAV